MGLSAALRVALSLMTYINPKSDELRPLREYSGRLPSSRPGKRLNPSTLFRWASQGVRGQVLETRLLGGTRVTCDAWVHEFMARLSEPGHSSVSAISRIGTKDRKSILESVGVQHGAEVGRG